jgi:hypothetical protein
MKILNKNSELKQLNPSNGETIILPNYRIDIISSSDGSFSKSKIMDRRTFKDLSYFCDIPEFIKQYLNKY